MTTADSLSHGGYTETPGRNVSEGRPCPRRGFVTQYSIDHAEETILAWLNDSAVIV